MKYKYIGDAFIQVKSPDPQTGKRVGLNTGDTVELDWIPGGLRHELVAVVEEAPKVAQAPKVVEAPVEKPKVKKTRFSSKKKKKD
jgi:hypothetical protein